MEKKKATDKHLDLWTGVSVKERKRALGWFVSLPESERMNVYEAALKKYMQIKDGHQDIQSGRHMRYSGLILAIREGGFDLARGRRTGQELRPQDIEAMRRLREIKAQNLRKGRAAPLRLAVMGYWGELKELRGKGMGFRLLSSYLAKLHRLKVSATYIAKLWKEIEVDVAETSKIK